MISKCYSSYGIGLLAILFGAAGCKSTHGSSTKDISVDHQYKIDHNEDESVTWTPNKSDVFTYKDGYVTAKNCPYTGSRDEILAAYKEGQIPKNLLDLKSCNQMGIPLSWSDISAYMRFTIAGDLKTYEGIAKGGEYVSKEDQDNAEKAVKNLAELCNRFDYYSGTLLRKLEDNNSDSMTIQSWVENVRGEDPKVIIADRLFYDFAAVQLAKGSEIKPDVAHRFFTVPGTTRASISTGFAFATQRDLNTCQKLKSNYSQFENSSQVTDKCLEKLDPIIETFVKRDPAYRPTNMPYFFTRMMGTRVTAQLSFLGTDGTAAASAPTDYLGEITLKDSDLEKCVFEKMEPLKAFTPPRN
jgi:hypothetical protein